MTLQLEQNKKTPFWLLLFLLAAAVVFIYQPWGVGLCELQGTEGLLVAEAQEYQLPRLVVSAHGMVIPGSYPLFPALGHFVKALLPNCELPVIMRLLSFAALIASAVVVGMAAASVRNRRAGFVAAAVYLTSLISIEKACEGMPAAPAALPVLLGQLLFFHFGIRKCRWNAAWIAALLLVTAGFLVDGFQALLYFFFPFLFFRRPLSVRTRFHYPGFWIGALIAGGTVALYLAATHQHAGETHSLLLFWNEFSLGGYLLTLLAFPFQLAGRLFPWIFIAWLPFCVALQALDSTPIYGRFLRTLTLSTLALLWLHPDIDPRNIFYLLGPLAIQIGMYYDLGMRRYGHKICRTGVVLEIFALVSAGVLLILPTISKDHLAALSAKLQKLGISIEYGLNFCSAENFRQELVAAAVLLAVAAAAIHTLRLAQAQRLYRSAWGMFLATAVVCGVLNCQLLRHYQSQQKRRSAFGAALKRIMPPGEIKTLYKNNIVGLYAELFYTEHSRIRYVDSPDKLPGDEKTVYLLSTVFPENPRRDWTNLGEVPYRGKSFTLWKGAVRRETASPQFENNHFPRNNKEVDHE